MHRRPSSTVATVALCAAVLTSCTTSGPAPTGSGLTTSARPTPTRAGPTSSPSSSESSAAPTSTPSTVSADAVVSAVGPQQWARIVAAGMARSGCPLRRTDLRRVDVGYWGFDGAVHRGVLVVNADVAASTARIFTRLFDARFPIHRMRPMEEYGGDDQKAMLDDDTSAYNCRTVAQQNAPPTASPHANGRAIDVNPYENPWQDPRCRCWSPSATYGTHRVGRGVIVKGDVVWTAFTDEHWIWQDINVTDWMHFDTGYPSKPFGSH